MDKGKILIVDDSEMNRSILADMLEDEYEILEAEDGVDGLAMLRSHGSAISLVLLDIVMPRLDGFGVLAAMNQSGLIAEVPVIMISAESGSAQVAKAYDLGVSDFIARPFDALIVRRRVVNTLLLYAKQKRLTAMVEEQIRETERQSSLMIEILSHIVEFRNGESGQHILHVRTLTDFLLRALMRKTDRYGLTSQEISCISVGSALHDIGKIVIDEHILNKPGRLTVDECTVMKTHSIKGAMMLDALEGHKDDPLIRTAYEICRWHHERYDGQGYPDGLVGDDIPISAQVVALADVYDALTSPRVYKPPFSHEKAVEMITGGQCGVFNPLLLECLTENAESIRALLAESGEQSAARESRNIVQESVRPANSSVSDRTLRLLDYERMKYSFFAAMTREIQFEYTISPSVISMTPWGAQTLGLDEIIMDPGRDPKLQAVLGDDGWAEMLEKLRQTTAEAPNISYDCQLTYDGQSRWYQIILRSIWSTDMPPRFEGALGKAIDIHDTHEKMTYLEKKAARDAMTGLYNRAAAKERIETRMADRPQSNYAMAIFDLDFFKSANDQYGHQFGDQVLKVVADRLHRSVRGSDIACRAGGDEFLLFLEYNTDIERTVDRIFHSLCGPYENYDISVTMGVALAQLTGKSYEALFQAADAALYAAKRAGRAQYRFYDESLKDTLSAISDIDDEQGGTDQ